MEVFWNTSVLIVLGSLLIIVADGLSWLRKPTDAQAPKGGSVTFHCEVDQSDKTVIWTNGSGSVLFSNTDRYNAPARYSIVGRYNLNISHIQESDNGQYVCNVQDFATETAILTVLLPPGPPVITWNFTGSSFTEGQVIVFVCESRGGNPNPTISWLKNGQEIFDSDYTPSSRVGGISSGRITRVLNRTDHKANYTCVVYNTINSNNKLTDSRILSVKYSPYITFRDYNPLYVLLGVNATITCQVDANPAVNAVTWKRGGKTLLGRQLTRYFRPTTKSHSGRYTCEASNGIGGLKRASIDVNVVYAPIITVPLKTTARELEPVQVTCNIDSNPKPYQFQWERVDGNQSFVRQNRILVFNRISRSDAGNYTCKAWSQIKVSGETPRTVVAQKFAQILVQYQPGNAFIKPVVDYNKGDRVVLKCEASPPGYPIADFEWKRGNSILSETRGTLTIASARLSDNGDYTCTPVNMVGRGGQSSITLTVNEPPRMIENPPAEITQPLTNTETLRLTCRVRGRPTPSVQWFKDDDTVSVTTLYPDFYSVELIDETTDQYSSQIKSILVFKGPGRKQTSNGLTALRVEDIGNYSCAVLSPAHAVTLRPRTQLNLQFRPRVSTREDRVAVNINDDAVLPCVALAFPTPTYQWYRNGQELITGQGHYLVQTTQLGPAEFRSDLTILKVKDTDLGEYKCFATNFLGNVSQPIGLTVKTVPEAPRNLRYTSQTWDSVMLAWDKGFSGGYPQTFHIRYSVGEKIRNISVIPISASKFNVTNLTPHTSYLFMVYSRNQKGDSALSKGVMTRTDDLRIPAIDTRPRYNSGTKKLIVDLKVDASYCLRVMIKTKSSSSGSDSRWVVYQPCMDLQGQNLYQVLESGVLAMNVSVCLSYRHDVCSSPVQVTITNPSSPGLTERDVIIIASICAVIIVTLLVVLVCFICRRRRLAGKDYQSEAATAQRTPPVNGTAPPPQKQSQTFDNADGPLDLKPPGYNRGRHLQPNGHVPHDTSYDSQLEKRMYENEMNRRNENVSKSDMYRPERQGDLHFHGPPRSPTKDKYIDLEEKSDPRLHGGGHDTPEPNKPKKVIYEVVV
ncbi:nephrin-like isoform X2 [Gigantopelta aegis]|uniref:nephrin-like isoform X2 n=1 Tax=Gigantopelta aegis TaxID=1735272 RepID=UPI001B8892E9|nr:nephrin-like isoform X2 [Gigantopelta aegis]